MGMTRDEAIEIEMKSARSWEPFSQIPAAVIREAAATTIDCYVALGMLKLEEPKSPMDKFYAITPRYFGGDVESALVRDLDAAGLKIVEK